MTTLNTATRANMSAAFRRLLLAGLVLIGGSALAPAAQAQAVFATPEEASGKLVAAARSGEPGALAAIFGPEAKALLSSGDPEVDAARLQNFLGLADKGTGVADGADGRKVLVFGITQWRFPIPLKQEKGGWTFDLAAGRQEITDRAVGRNELVAISACADYVAAQRDYFGTLHDDEPVQQYARKLISTPGKHDGLWWAPESRLDRSPLGELIALPRDASTRRPGSYQGYVYRILTRQGPGAPGGAYDYEVKGRLLAGFALIASPLTWGKTGVMTFLCDQRGQVWQRNLGPDTSRIAGKITSFDPEGWELLAPGTPAGASASN